MVDRLNDFETQPYRRPMGDEGQPRKRGFSLGIVLFLLLLVALAAVGFFISRTGLDRKSVEARLNEWTHYAGSVVQGQGYQLGLNYSDIQIEGNILSRHAHIVSPALTFTPVGSGSVEPSLSVTTESIDLIPGILGGDTATLRLGKPLVLTDAHGRLRLTPSERMDSVMEAFNEKGGSGLAYALTLPHHLLLERLGRQSDSVISTTTLGFGEKSKINGRIDGSKFSYRQDMAITSLTAKSNEREITAAGLTSQMEAANDNGSKSSHYTGHIEKLASNGPFQSLGPIDSDFDLAFDTPQGVEGEAVSGNTIEKNVRVEKILLTFPSTKMLASANLRVVAGELVPFGTASIEIDHPDQLVAALEKTDILHGVNHDLVVTMLKKTVPEWKGGDTPIRIETKREPNAPFYIGALTFENFTAQLLNQLLQQSGDIPLLGSTQSMPPSTVAPGSPAVDTSPSGITAASPPAISGGGGMEHAPVKQMPPTDAKTNEPAGDSDEDDDDMTKAIETPPSASPVDKAPPAAVPMPNPGAEPKPDQAPVH